jgi:hypothetical protein
MKTEYVTLYGTKPTNFGGICAMLWHIYTSYLQG